MKDTVCGLTPEEKLDPAMNQSTAPRHFLDHLKDTAKADDLLKQDVYFEIIDIIVQQQMLASALQEMRKARHVSVLADEVTSRNF